MKGFKSPICSHSAKKNDVSFQQNVFTFLESVTTVPTFLLYCVPFMCASSKALKRNCMSTAVWGILQATLVHVIVCRLVIFERLDHTYRIFLYKDVKEGWQNLFPSLSDFMDHWVNGKASFFTCSVLVLHINDKV